MPRHGIVISVVAASMVVRSLCYAQFAPPQVTVTPLPVGSGARALGRGGAFTAVADDATSASWNPAGMVQLAYAELSIVGSFLRTADRFSSHTQDVRIGKETYERPDLNYASVVLPVPRKLLGRQTRFSLNYQQVYDFHVGLSFDQTLRGPTSELPLHYNIKSTGAISALSPALAVAVTPDFWVGGAVNFLRDELGGNDAWTITTSGSGSGDVADFPVDFSYRSKETYKNFDGVNATFGVMWRAWRDKTSGEKQLTLGCTFETPCTAHVVREVETVTVLNGVRGVAPRDRTKFDMKLPMSAIFGVDFRFCDEWSLSADVQWTKWSDFVQIDRSMPKGSLDRRSSPIGGISHQAKESSKIADTYAGRLGTEYLFILDEGLIPVRAGLFWEQRPSLGHAEAAVGFSLGTGLRTRLFSLDCAYQFRHARGFGGRDLGLVRNVEFDRTEHMLLASVIWYF